MIIRGRVIALLLFAALVIAGAVALSQPAESVDPSGSLDDALYAKVPFFGAETRVPFAAADARVRVANLRESHPDDAKVAIKLAELDEALGNYDLAEATLAALPAQRRPLLAAFYERRAEFDKSADVLASIFESAPNERRASDFAALVEFAGRHDIAKYRSKKFFEAAAVGETDSTTIVGALLDKLTADESFDDALAVIDAAEARLPENLILARRVAILDAARRPEDAVKTYVAAFRTDWTPEQSAGFYEFLRERDALTAYLSGTESRFKNNSADFDAAARLIDRRRDQNEDFSDVVKRLESARAAAGKRWSPDELLALADYLAGNDDDGAVRMLYTIASDFSPAVKSDLRREVLYRMFTIVANAGDQELAVTRGNADFLSSVAATDVRPGFTTAALALIFSDAGMEEEFDDAKPRASRLFNRAAAFRIMRDFRNEYPGSPQLASMYLDIVRLYAPTTDRQIAADALKSFEDEFGVFDDYTGAALKLAEAHAAAKDSEKERAVLQSLLDRLGALPQPKFRDAFTTPADEIVLYGDVLGRLVASFSRSKKTGEIIAFYAAETEKYPSEARLANDFLKWLGETSLTDREEEVYRRAVRDFGGASWTERYARWMLRNKRDAEFEKLAQSVVETFSDAETRDFLTKFVENGDAKNAESRLFLGLYTAAHERFPNDRAFVAALLKFYRREKMDDEWRRLAAEYFFTEPEIRAEYLTELARSGELRVQLASAEDALASRTGIERSPLVLFIGAASARLSEFERAAGCYRELAASHPQSPEFADEFAKIVRSLGETNRELLAEAAELAERRAASAPTDAAQLTTAGEIAAELGDYDRAKVSWDKIAALTSGENDGYLATASVFWDYFRFDDALRTIAELRLRRHRDDLFAFQAGAVLESAGRPADSFLEYLKAIRGSAPREDELRAKRRLAELAARPGLAPAFERAYEAALAEAPDKFRLAFNYADVYFRMKQTPRAVAILREFAARERDPDNLDVTRRFFIDVGDHDAAREILTRLTTFATRPRDAVRHSAELAAELRDAGRTSESATVLKRLLGRFPKSFGVIGEVESGLWSAGKRREAIEVLRRAREISNAEFRYRFDRRIAELLTEDGRDNEAVVILQRLFNADRGDTVVFGELRELYVRLRRPAQLRECLRDALDELRSQKLRPPEFAWRAAELHRETLPAFLALGDDDAAAAEYVEIINADPSDETAVDDALAFARRRGTTSQLIAYYKQLSSEAFKNYRWNVVLAQLYEAGDDHAASESEYRLAIASRPELPELYEALFAVQMKRRNFVDALETASKLVEIAGESDSNLLLKIAVLNALGRKDDADAERLKLSASASKKSVAQTPTILDEPATAERYRAMVEAFANSPLTMTITSSDIESYVRLARPEEGLGAVAARLWPIHDKLAAEAKRANSPDTGRAAQLLQTTDTAIVSAIGFELRTNALSAEIEAVRREISARLQSTDNAFAFRLAGAFGFDDLVEQTLRERASGKNDEARRELIGFYTKRANHAAIVELLKPDADVLSTEFLGVAARAARFVADDDFELDTLRKLFYKTDAGAEFVPRFVEILLKRGRDELASIIADETSPRRLQVINLLLANGETELASAAIANSPFPASWKKTRLAEVGGSADNFRRALGETTIGELLKADTERLPRDSWFVTAGRFGRGGLDDQSRNAFVAAETERRPKDVAAQRELGYVFHRSGDPARSLEHFRLALALDPDDRDARVYAGAALYSLGRREEALGEWGKLVAGEKITATDVAEYIRALGDFGEFELAREQGSELVEKLLERADRAATATEFGNAFRAIASTFADKRDAAQFLLRICRRAPRRSETAALIGGGGIVDDDSLEPFLELAARDADSEAATDYDFMARPEAKFDQRTAELLDDAANNFPGDRDGDFSIKRTLVEYQLKHHRNALKTIVAIENEIRGERARPLWLRLARIRLSARGADAGLNRELFDFTGISESDGAPNPTLPDSGRLDAALAVLREEKAVEAENELHAAFFARRLAGQQLTVDDLDGLARASFNSGDVSTALEIVGMMTAPNNENLATRISALPIVAKFAFRSTLPETVVVIDEAGALAAAAVTMTEFGYLPEAASFRMRLAEISAENVVNRIELARLKARLGVSATASELFVNIIADASLSRTDRWRAIIAAGEMSDAAQLTAMASDARIASDAESAAALKAFAAAARADFTGAVGEISSSGAATPELLYLAAGFAQKAGDFAEAARLAGIIQARGNMFDSARLFSSAGATALLAEAELDAGHAFTTFSLVRSGGAFNLSAYRRTSDFALLDNAVAAARSVDEARIAKKVALSADAAGETDLAAMLAEKLRAGAPESEHDEAVVFAAEMRRKADEKTRRKTISPVLNERDF